MQVDLGRQFMERVVDWPGPQGAGWINLHSHHKNGDPAKNGGKDFVVGWPFKTIDDFINKVMFVDNKSTYNFDAWYCTSQQSETGVNTNKNLKAVRKSANAITLKAIWIDCDVKPDDTEGKHYLSDGEALDALAVFWKKVGLPDPSAIVHSGGGFHVYWISDVAMSPQGWRSYSEGLKQLLLAEGLKCDTGLTTDSCRLLRVPGTKNHKYSPARTVKVLHLGQDYDFPTQLAFLTTVPAAAKAVTATVAAPAVVRVADISSAFDGQTMLADFAGLTGSLQAGIDKPITRVVPTPIFEQCAFLGDALRDGGANYKNPLWNLSVLCTAFMENGDDYAHAISSGHEGYTAADTQALYDRKVADRAERDIGYPSCSTIQGAGCKACATCPLFSKGKSPLNIRPEFTAAVTRSVTADDLQLPDEYDVDGKGIINYMMPNPKKPGEQLWVPLFHSRLKNPRMEKNPDQLCFTVSYDKGNWIPAHILVENMRGQGAEKAWLRANIKPLANADLIGRFFVAWSAKLHDASIAQTAQPFGWYRDGGVGDIKGFAFGGLIHLTVGGTKPAGLSDKKFQDRYMPTGELSPWFAAASYITRQQRPDLEVIIATAFAAPLMEFTGVVSGMLSTYGESGVGKSYALSIGAAVWGHPTKTKETITSTTKGVLNRLGATPGLPCYWDEITEETVQNNVLGVAMQSSAGIEGSRLTSNIEQRDRGTWSTLLAINSNVCFKEYVARKQATHAAGLNRVLEYKVEHAVNPVGAVQPYESDAALRQLQQNYGLVGQAYAEMLAADPAKIAAEVHDTMKFMSQDFNADREDRFWVGISATLYLGAIYGNRIAKQMQQPEPFEVVALYDFLKKVFEENRQNRITEGVRPSALSFVEDWLTQYLKQRTNQTLWIENAAGPGGHFKPQWRRINPNAPSNHGISVVFATADRKLRWSKLDFKEWCKLKALSSTEVVNGLKKNFGMVEDKRIIAAGTIWKSGQEHCYVIDVTGHPSLEAMMDAEPNFNADLGASFGIAAAAIDTGITTPDGESDAQP